MIAFDLCIDGRNFTIFQPITVDTIRGALASREHERGPICGDWNYGCTLFLLREGKPELLLAPGRPDRFGFQSFGF
jgi:hypothetical protein